MSRNGCILAPHVLQVDGLQMASYSRGVDNGATGISIRNGGDNMVTNFNYTTRFVKDIAIQGPSIGTVVSKGQYCMSSLWKRYDD
jgi:hypothetical protein